MSQKYVGCFEGFGSVRAVYACALGQVCFVDIEH